jgi:hypothetical protein
MGISLVACLDDDKYALDPSGTDNVIEFFDPSVPSSPVGAIYPVWTATTEIDATFEFEQTISYSGPNGNSKDIELTLAVDEVALVAYNEQMAELGGGTYVMMPDSYYDFTDLTVTIPKGEKKVNISITTYPVEFDLTKTFALPLRITSTSEGILSSNWSVAILAVVVKNEFDGVYEIMAGNIQRNSGTGPDPALSGDYIEGLEMELNTINGNTNGFEFFWKNGGGIAGIDGTRVVTYKDTPNPDGTYPILVSATTNPLLIHLPGDNYYDPLTRTYYMNVRWGVDPNSRVITGLEMTWVRARD